MIIIIVLFIINKKRNNNHFCMDNSHLFFEVGSCELIFGPMFARKTSLLTAELNESSDIELKCLYINNSKDVRDTKYYSDSISSHSSQFSGLSDKVDRKKETYLKDIDIDKYDVIGIDEGQFFDDLNEVVRIWVLEKNKRVIIASLDGDFNMNPFGQAHLLICLCEPGGIKKLGARCKRCMIKKKPYRHYRLIPAGFTRLNVDTDNTSQILVGGQEEYEAVCMKCHIELNK